VKKAVPVIVLVVLAVALGPRALQWTLDWRQTEEARKRVEWMIRAKVADDEQVAICQWARGKIVMPMGDIEASLPAWEDFWKQSGFGDARGWTVVSKRVLDELTTEVIVTKGDDRRTLHVRDKEPLELVWEN